MTHSIQLVGSLGRLHFIAIHVDAASVPNQTFVTEVISDLPVEGRFITISGVLENTDDTDQIGSCALITRDQGGGEIIYGAVISNQGVDRLEIMISNDSSSNLVIGANLLLLVRT